MSRISEEFLAKVNSWRIKLAQTIYENNKGREFFRNEISVKLSFGSASERTQSLKLIGECVQGILNPLLNLRFIEDNYRSESSQLSRLNDHWKKNKTGDSLYSLVMEALLKIQSNFFIRIFENDPIYEQIIISNEILSEILQDFCSQSFQGFPSDILGIIYECYLGTELILKNDIINLQQSQEIQKARGIYYTPPFIIQSILQYALNAYLQDHLNKSQRLLENKKIDEFLAVLSNLRQIKILDPACGSGNFLLAAYNMIQAHFSQIKNLIATNLSSNAKNVSKLISNLEMEILNNNIFGVDFDPQAVVIAAVNLMVQLSKTGEKVPLPLKNNLKVGNSLISGDKSTLEPLYGPSWKEIHPFIWENEFPDQKFTAVVGNPPYLSWNKIPHRKIFEGGKYLDLEYDCRPNHEDAQPNIYLFFLIRAINLIKTGKIGFILPQEWRFENYARKFRNYLLEKSNAIRIIRFNPQFKVFKIPGIDTGKKIGTNSLILFLDITETKDPNRKLIEYYIDELDEVKIISYLTDSTHLEKNSIKIEKNFADLTDIPWIFPLSHEEQLKRKIESHPDLIYLNDTNHFHVKGGFQPPVTTISHYQINADVLSTLSEKEKQYVYPAILDASELQRYFLNRQDRYWIILNDIDTEMELKKSCPNLFKIVSKNVDTTRSNWWKFPNIRNFDLIKKFAVKILTPRTASRNSFCIDDNHAVFKGTNTMIIALQLDPYYLIGILNSSLAHFWYSKFGFEYHGEKTKKFEPQKVREYSIPIIKPPIKDIEAKLITLSQKLISLKKSYNSPENTIEIQKIEENIDIIVFSLYNLNIEEINLVKHNTFFSL